MILRSVRYGDDDRVVTFYSLEEGLLTGFARAANATGNRFGPALSPMNFSSLIGRHHIGDSLFRLHKAHVIDPFQNIREDYDRMVWAGLPVRAVLSFMPPRAPEPALFELFLRMMCLLDQGEVRPCLLWLRFAARLLRILGFGPLSPVCQGCGVEIITGKVRYNPENGRVRCRDCAGQDGEKSHEPVCGADSLRILEGFSAEDLFARDRVILSPVQEHQLLTLVDGIFAGHLRHWTGSKVLSQMGNVGVWP